MNAGEVASQMPLSVVLIGIGVALLAGAIVFGIVFGADRIARALPKRWPTEWPDVVDLGPEAPQLKGNDVDGLWLVVDKDGNPSWRDGTVFHTHSEASALLEYEYERGLYGPYRMAKVVDP